MNSPGTKNNASGRFEVVDLAQVRADGQGIPAIFTEAAPCTPSAGCCGTPIRHDRGYRLWGQRRMVARRRQFAIREVVKQRRATGMCAIIGGWMSSTAHPGKRPQIIWNTRAGWLPAQFSVPASRAISASATNRCVCRMAATSAR